MGLITMLWLLLKVIHNITHPHSSLYSLIFPYSAYTAVGYV